jgi:predicted hotdog family 3-hydroxylacyl-ACP dehydratase
MLSRNEIENLIPHKGAMCLLDRVLTWDNAGIRMATRTHRDNTNPLRSTLGLRSVHLCEYGAQAMALHGALLAQSRQHAAFQNGLLASLRNVKLYCVFIHDLPNELIVTAECGQAGDTLLQYLFRVHHDNVLLAEGRATVVLQAP